MGPRVSSSWVIKWSSGRLSRPKNRPVEPRCKATFTQYQLDAYFQYNTGQLYALPLYHSCSSFHALYHSLTGNLWVIRAVLRTRPIFGNGPRCYGSKEPFGQGECPRCPIQAQDWYQNVESDAPGMLHGIRVKSQAHFTAPRSLASVPRHSVDEDGDSPY